MTEQTLLPPPGDMPGPAAAPPRRQYPDVLPWLCGLGFIVLAVAIAYVWQFPNAPRGIDADSRALRATAQQIADMESRLSRIEKHPPPDFGQLIARVDALDGRVADQTQLASRLDTLSGRIESLSGRNQTGIDATGQKIDELAARVAALEASAGAIEAVTKRLNRIARLQEASFALESGRPIGDVPDAPEALARFAHTPPPTEASLRLRFAPAEQAALASKQPDAAVIPLVDRVLQRAESLITIKRGNDIVVGSPSAVALGRARSALDLGDLQGAVTAVETLNGQPAEAMAQWLADAKAILAARSALDQMADKA